MNMMKHMLALLVLSIIIVFSMSYAQLVTEYLLLAHAWIAQLLTDVFSGGQAGNLARGLIALLSLPFIAALIPTIVYWIVRRHWFPYFLQIVWVVWLVQAGALLVASQA